MINYEKYKQDLKDDQFSLIKNKKIQNIYISDAKYYICFEYEWYPYRVIYRASGDCCNEVWINHVNGIKNILNSKIIEIIEKREDLEEEGSQGFVQKILYTFKTNKGYFDVELRNDHNGYYGGYLTSFTDSESCMPLIPDLNIKWNKILEDF